MDFDLTAEQRDLQRICRSFADEEIVPYVREHRAGKAAPRNASPNPSGG